MARMTRIGMPIPRVLSIAGTDPTGGAGVQADLKSISAVGGYGMAVVTALVAQNTAGVRAIHRPPPLFLDQQLRAVSDDVTVDAVKIGMLGTSAVIGVVDRWLRETSPAIVVLDPVLIASGGQRLADVEAEGALRTLLPRVHLVTPNLAELAVLSGDPLATEWDDAIRQGMRLSAEHDVKVLVTGGHLGGPRSPDALLDAAGELTGGHTVVRLDGARIPTTATHGTGCSLSSAVATIQARVGDWAVAVAEAKEWIGDSIRHANLLDVGSGSGPIHHFHRLWTASGVTVPPAEGGWPPA